MSSSSSLSVGMYGVVFSRLYVGLFHFKPINSRYSLYFWHTSALLESFHLALAKKSLTDSGSLSGHSLANLVSLSV
jgi:hypothetical protein